MLRHFICYRVKSKSFTADSRVPGSDCVTLNARRSSEPIRAERRIPFIYFLICNTFPGIKVILSRCHANVEAIVCILFRYKEEEEKSTYLTST